jgi:hypothetical protein
MTVALVPILCLLFGRQLAEVAMFIHLVLLGPLSVGFM